MWVALQAHGVSDHLVWTMQNLYSGQLGRKQGDTVDSRVFPITAGVRQGRVLSKSHFLVTENLLVGKEYPHIQVLPSKFPT